MYKIIYLPTGEEVTIPYNDHGNSMTIKQLRRFLRTDKAYPVRYHDKEIYFTTEGEFQDTHPNYNRELCVKLGRTKICKNDLRVRRG
jgi:hypothetical protein